MNILKFVYESINCTLIKQFHNYFRFHHTIHNRQSRQTNHLYSERVHNKYGESTLNYTRSKLWNSLNLNLQNSSSLYTFKKAVRQQIMASYLQ